MAAIKRFFEKKKLDIKFKKAGEGRKLADDSKQQGTSHAHASIAQGKSPSQGSAAPRNAPAQGASLSIAPAENVNSENLAQVKKKVAEAALARQNQPKPGAGGVGTGEAAIKLAVRRQIEEEKRLMAKEKDQQSAYGAASRENSVLVEDVPYRSTVTAVYFKCPSLLGPDTMLPKLEMEHAIEEFLLSQLVEEPSMTSALIIYTLNKDKRDKVRPCIDTLLKYLDNIVQSPGEEKYRKIRISNKVFQERVAPLRGTDEFLRAVGFQKQLLPVEGGGGGEEEFYFLPLPLDEEGKKSESETLATLSEILRQAEPILPELARNAQVFRATSDASAAHMEVPPEFYNITPEELKREQQLQAEAVEKLGMLRTKDMRERDRQRELRRYRYCIIRLRFPDGLLLQGMFRAQDKLDEVVEFVRQCVVAEWMPFELSTGLGRRLNEEKDRASTLAELDLPPGAVLHFCPDQEIQAQLAAEQHVKLDEVMFLQEELLADVKSL